MTREEIEQEVKSIFLREFEIENPGMDANLREAYEFDSIDAIELLLEIERFLGSNQICDYIEKIALTRGLSPAVN